VLVTVYCCKNVFVVNLYFFSLQVKKEACDGITKYAFIPGPIRAVANISIGSNSHIVFSLAAFKKSLLHYFSPNKTGGIQRKGEMSSS
jgi:hypothetical protein